MKKPEKGKEGYFTQKRLRQGLYTLTLVIAAFAIFILGLLLNKMEKTNIFTVVAILMVLPAAKMLIGFIILVPFRASDEKLITRMKEHIHEQDEVYYDAVFTSKEHIMHLNCMVFTGNSVLGYSEREKDDVGQIQSYFSEVMRKRGLSFSVFITKDLSAFLRHLDVGTRPDEETMTEDRENISEFLRISVV